MKNYFLCWFYLFIVIFHSCACDSKYRCITLKNSSNRTIYAVNSICSTEFPSDYFMQSLCYPDTSVPVQSIYDDWYKILPNGNNEHSLCDGRHGDWKYEFEHNIDTLMIYIFDEEVLKNNAWEDVINNYLVLQRYDLSLQDLEKLNWKICYPPTEAMKDMKMYPPYKEKGNDN